MAGQPQIREWAMLFEPGRDIHTAYVRLEERMDGSGIWDLYLADPPTKRSKGVPHPSEESARKELARI